MKILKLAIETQRWDLAAHVLIFATPQVKDGPNGESDSARRRENDAKKEKRRSQGQPRRS